LRAPVFVEGILNLLEEAGLPARFLDLEETDGVLIERPKETAEKLQTLKRDGVSIK